MAERTVLDRKGASSMVKVRWTEAAPGALNDVGDAEELGAVWEGDELVTYDIGGSANSSATTRTTTTR